jgi:hypothetical protein
MFRLAIARHEGKRKVRGRGRDKARERAGRGREKENKGLGKRKGRGKGREGMWSPNLTTVVAPLVWNGQYRF